MLATENRQQKSDIFTTIANSLLECEASRL